MEANRYKIKHKHLSLRSRKIGSMHLVYIKLQFWLFIFINNRDRDLVDLQTVSCFDLDSRFRKHFSFLILFEVQLINQIYAFEMWTCANLFPTSVAFLEGKSGLHKANASSTPWLYQNNSINYVISQIDF